MIIDAPIAAINEVTDPIMKLLVGAYLNTSFVLDFSTREGNLISFIFVLFSFFISSYYLSIYDLSDSLLFILYAAIAAAT